MNPNQQIRVFTRATVIRLGHQNRVLRTLRQLGCKVTTVSMDAGLTIAIKPTDAFRLGRHPGGLSKRRTDEGCVVCIDVDGCRVIWVEGAAS